MAEWMPRVYLKWGGWGPSAVTSTTKPVLSLWTLATLAWAIHAQCRPHTRLKRAIKFMVKGCNHRRKLSRLHDFFQCHERAPVMECFPAILEKPVSPYLMADWGIDERIAAIESHFQFLSDWFGSQCLEIYKPTGLRLFEFTALDHANYCVELFQGYQNEGSIGLRICDGYGREIYTLTFHIQAELHACPKIIIGALQGPNNTIENRNELITMLTKSLHGLRPKALLVESLYTVAHCLEIEIIYGVSKSAHILQSKRYSDKKREQMKLDMDNLWLEFSAVRHSSTLFQLPSQPVHKALREIQSKKRAAYRRRYHWLTKIRGETSRVLEQMSVV